MKNEYTVTRKLMKSWAKGWYFNSAINTAFLILLCFLTAFLFYLSYLFMYLAKNNADFEMLYRVVFYVLHAVFLLYIWLIFFLPYGRCLKRYYFRCMSYSVKSWQRSIELTDGEIIVKDHRSIFKYQYRTIIRVKVRGNVVHIFLKSGAEIIMHKDAFVSGSWDECKKLISQKSYVKIK